MGPCAGKWDLATLCSCIELWPDICSHVALVLPLVKTSGVLHRWPEGGGYIGGVCAICVYMGVLQGGGVIMAKTTQSRQLFGLFLIFSMLLVGLLLKSWSPPYFGRVEIKNQGFGLI